MQKKLAFDKNRKYNYEIRKFLNTAGEWNEKIQEGSRSMKKTRMPQRLLALVLVLMMLISVLPVSAMAAELTPADAQTGLTATDVTNELTDSDRLSIFEENMDPS